MLPDSDQTPEANSIIYKYTDRNGVAKILSTRTLRFARPSEMNDPFDVYIEDLFGMDLDEVYERQIDALFDTLLTNPQLLAERCGLSPEKVENSARLVRSSSEGESATLREFFKSIDMTALDPEYKALREAQPALRDHCAHYFRNCGIFCASRTPSNLLMWSHYAEQHRGAVLGFKADLERDSMLAKIEPVTYGDERPFLLDEPGLMSSPTLESSSKSNRRVYLTKSKEWSYEEELRLVIPAEVKPGEPASFNRYYPHELVELFLGCRMSEETRAETIRLARGLNPDMRVFSVSLARRKYALEFSRLV
jgi:hypothetical protein